MKTNKQHHCKNCGTTGRLNGKVLGTLSELAAESEEARLDITIAFKDEKSKNIEAIQWCCAGCNSPVNIP